MGFVYGKGTYMSDYWNWVDFVVVISSLGEIMIRIVSFGSISLKAPPAVIAIRLVKPIYLPIKRVLRKRSEKNKIELELK
jgi:hypothetical protein